VAVHVWMVATIVGESRAASVANGIACDGPVSPGMPMRPMTDWAGTGGNVCAARRKQNES
jgi:hypothetical protein